MPTRRLVLSRDEVVAAWRRLGLGDRPVLIDVPDHGATLPDRDAADHAALHGLRDRGLADGAEVGAPVPVADLADALRVLERPEVDVDLRCWDPEPRGFLAAVSGELTVVVETRPGHAWCLDLVARPPGTGAPDLVAALARLVLTRLPDERPTGTAMEVPTDVLFAGAPTHRLPPAVGKRIEALRAEPPRRRLQLGARAGRRRVGPLTVVDGAEGRALVELDGDTVRVRPADRVAIVRELARRANPAQGPARLVTCGP
ncbi:ESX secretion-associated protein EspG [Actinomycetospora chiangmaiensis]|uniref:ESX secretion-associated protein EspG n=1 Tax=Actinomycetospora chiangmaiensis TaxID=402650 RepID=UPI0012F97FDE|nr:ESX secretion-associated protein EspG [Actinomycetospora chiangmaiensis]